MKKTLLLMVSLIFFSGCTYIISIDGPYKGKVVDKETGEPIEGVVVLAVWRTNYPTGAGGISEYNDAQETVTDKDGAFKLKGKGFMVLSTVELSRITFFKAGYSFDYFNWKTIKGYYWKEGGAFIPLKKLTMEERVKGSGPHSPPHEAPKEKIIHMLNEINKDRREQGLNPISVGR